MRILIPLTNLKNATLNAWHFFWTSKKIFLFLLPLSITVAACGTFTPIPSQGGGKRYAIEQALSSAVIRAAFSQLPLGTLRNEKISVTISIIADEGGGAINGGRAQFTSAALATLNSAAQSTWAGALSLGSQRGELNYAKDNIYAVSDQSYAISTLLSILKRNNISVVAEQKDARYNLDILVDVLGIVRDRTDWIALNSENLAAYISMEFALTPNKINAKREIERYSFRAYYKEEYVLWTGPLTKKIAIEKIDLSDLFEIYTPAYEEAVKADISSQFIAPKNNDVKSSPYIPRATGRSR